MGEPLPLRAPADDRERRRCRALLAAAFAATLAIGIAKLYWQRQHPPSFALLPGNMFDGFVSIDGYSHRAAAIRDAIVQLDLAPLRASLHSDLHLTTWTVPLLVGLLSLLLGSTVAAFVVVVVAAQGLCTWLVARIASASVGAPAGTPVGLIAAILFTCHLDAVRIAAQLHLDMVLAAMVAGAAVLAWRAAQPGAGTRPHLWLVGLHLAGVFTKTSYLPALAFGPLALLVCRRGAGAVLRATALALAPLAVAGVYLLSLDRAAASGADFEHLASSWRLTSRQVGRWAVEMLLLWQWWPLVAARVCLLTPAGRWFVTAGLVVFAATAACGLPVIPRLYAPVLAIVGAAAAALASPLLRARPWLLAAIAALNYAAVLVATFAGG